MFKLDYRPKLLQYYWALRMRRFNALICHRQLGKSVFGIFWLVVRLLFTTHKHPVGVVASKTVQQVYKNIFIHMNRMCRFIPKKYYRANKTDMMIFIKRPFADDEIIIYFIGAESEDSNRGDYADAILVDEAAFLKESYVDKILMPKLKTRKGSILLISTLNGANWFWKRCKQWYLRYKSGDDLFFVHEINVNESCDSTREEIDIERKTKSERAFRAESLNDPYASIKGKIFQREVSYLYDQGCIRKIFFNPTLPVFTLWDFGIGRKCVCIVGQVSSEGNYNVIDYFDGGAGGGTLDVARKLKSSGYGPYVKDFFLPWDNIMTSSQRKETHDDVIREIFKKAPVKFHIARRFSSKALRIDKSREFIYKIRFNKENCGNLIKNLTHFSYEEDSSGSLTEVPVDNEYADTSDAITLLGSYGSGGIEKKMHLQLNGMCNNIYKERNRKVQLRLKRKRR